MRAETISKVHDFTLEARALLQKEVEEQLEGIYGLLPNGRWEPVDRYPALQEIEEAKVTRTRLEQFLRDEQAAGVTPAAARQKLVREAAFTWLNRLVAFRMLEARGLIRQAVSKGPQSRGFLLWLTEPGNETHYENYEKGDLPQNALGEGPRQEAYRHFILWQCGQLAQEIRVLFDPDDLASRLLPRPRVLAQLTDWMNAPDLEEAWAPGNEETIGWIYQAFNSQELEQAFREARLSGKKFEAEDIPKVTQLFTPRWIVRYLVENTLGRLWVNMHPDSALKKELAYLVPLNSTDPEPLKPVREIRLLDPACGTMHFGLVAFDLFVRMYQEELENAGKPGWPDKPSVANEEEIAAAIVAHNLYGIDIDLRAVQLSALTLYLRAKTLNPQAHLKESKLAVANVRLIDGERLQTFLEETGIKSPVLVRILKVLQERLKDSEQLGSLLRLEQEIQALVERERLRFEKEGRQPDVFGWSQGQFDTAAGREEFWEVLAGQIEQALHFFAQSQAAQDRDQSFFVKETAKGLRLLELLSQQYDVVVTNPPYMANGKMNLRLKTLVIEKYPKCKNDLYAAFIQRCIELARKRGRVGMLSMHTFMFLGSYEKMRHWILEHTIFETMAHLGPALFSVGNPGTLQTAAYVLLKETDKKKQEESSGIFFRLVKERDGESKLNRFEKALSLLKTGGEDSSIFNYHQKNFYAIPGIPLVYWIIPKLRNLFNMFPKFGDKAPAFHGTTTYDNFRFIRYWWEIGLSNIGLNLSDWSDFTNSNKDYVPCMKGGPFKKWYGNNEYVLQLIKKGRVLSKFLEDKNDSIRAQKYIFKKGLTWNKVTSGNLSIRLSPGGFIFSDAGISAFPDESNLYQLLGILNSSVIRLILTYISPTINYEVGHIAKLPIPDLNSDYLENYVKMAIGLSIIESSKKEINYNYISPPKWFNGILEETDRLKSLTEIEELIDEEVYRLYAIEDNERKVIEIELAETTLIEDKEEKGDDKVETSEESAPDEAPLTREELARKWISYAVGIVLGRFHPGVEGALGRGNFTPEVAAQLRNLAASNGILVMDEGHPDDLRARVLQALALMVGEGEVTPLIQAATGKTGPAEELLRQYLERQFFKLHIQQYRKRPVYWFLQSPRKKYGLWLFHEKLTDDTLLWIRSHYVEPKVNLLQSHITELQGQRDGAEGRERRRLQKEIEELQDILDDVRQFAQRLKFISEERGYRPHLDDGVLLNMAPLWELIPSWQAEPKKAWQALEAGKYDWAYQAMDHWPERVKEKCKTNKSYAIAHGLEIE